MFKSLGKSCYRSLNIGMGMSEQRPRSDCSGTAVFPILPAYVCGNSDESQISESQICIIHFFSKATAAQMASVSI